MIQLKSILCVLLFVSLAFSGSAQNKPNIVLLFADDAGYADFGFHDSKVMKTPNLDRLASESVMFTQGYVTDPTCGPSRAGLVTGKYQQRFGYEENNVPGFMSPVSAQLGPEMGLPVDEETIGDVLQKQGYKTAYYGKWHLGGADRFHPTRRGFDEFYGFRGGARSFFPYPEVPADSLNRLEKGFANFKEHDGYLTDALSDEAIDFIERNRSNPFFVFLSFNAVHTPMEALEEDKEQFPELTGDRQTVAAMTLAMDRACGKILDKLRELGLDENTIVVFANDNGGPTDKNASINLPLAGTKSNHLEGGIRVPFTMKWANKIEPNSQYDYPVSMFDLLPTFYVAAGGDEADLNDIDGVDLIPFVNGNNKARPHEKLFWKKDARAALRKGDWKLIRFPDRPAELYNIIEDPSEQNNLAYDNMEMVREMYKEIFEWELTLERPRWMLKKEFEKVDIDRMDLYKKVESPKQ